MKTTSNHQFYVSHFLRTMVLVDNIVCFALDHHRCKVRFSLIFLKHINCIQNHKVQLLLKRAQLIRGEFFFSETIGEDNLLVKQTSSIHQNRFGQIGSSQPIVISLR